MWPLRCCTAAATAASRNAPGACRRRRCSTNGMISCRFGAAAGTLIGSMFVVVLDRQRVGEGSHQRIFVTPTIIHLAAVLMSCAFVMMPTLTRFGLGAAAGIGGIAFLYAGRNMLHIHRRAELLWSDWVWYGVAPLCAYLPDAAAQRMVSKSARFAIEAIAVAGAPRDQRHSQRVGSGSYFSWSGASARATRLQLDPLRVEIVAPQSH